MSASPAKISAAIANARRGTAAVQARIAERPLWHCQHCGKTELATVHRMRNRYCYGCVAPVFRQQMRGSANPNYRAASHKACAQCGGDFHSYDAKRKFCSQPCYRGYYMEGKAKRKAPKCRTVSGRKDSNHDAIVAVFEKLGCKVADTSVLGFGFPDLCIAVIGVVALVEVKNPDTFYGRQELSGFQREFHSKWEGCAHVVRTQDEAIALVQKLRQSRFRMGADESSA
jgi:hypothetical protein